MPPRTPTGSAEQHGKQDHLTGHEHSSQALEHSQRRMSILGVRPDMASRLSGTTTSPRWRMSCGKPGAVRKDRRKRIGFVPRNNYEPAVTPLDPAPEDRRCPKCGAAMEAIESRVEGLPLEHLQLCPECYLVIWRDQDGFQIRQGVPVKAAAIRRRAEV